MAAKPKILGGLLKPLFDKILSDAQEETFLPQDVQAKLANRLNAVIDLPVFNEQQEQAIFIKVVRAFDKHTFKFVPKEILNVAFTSGKALPVEIVSAIRQNLPAILISAVPLPFVGPIVREALVNAFINPLLTALGTGHVLGDLLKKHN